MSIPEAVFFSLNTALLFWRQADSDQPRVLSRTSSTHSKTNLDTNDTEKPMGAREKIPVDFEQELSILKKQISTLQITVNSMQRDTERKETALANLSKEKEQLTMDLKKQKRSNVNLKQQLEDERSFYYKEKEQYCQEMNSHKKKHKSSSKESSVRDFNENNYKNEIAKLKDELSAALEANYNLSVKFLRMKNTKLGLKQELAKLREMYELGGSEHMKKVVDIKKELDDVVNEQFTKPIPPSSKKYLQVLKHNGTLIHENLCLQLELDRMHLEINSLKMLQMNSETKSKLKYIRRSADTSKSSKIQLSVTSLSEKSETPLSVINKNKEPKKQIKDNSVTIINSAKTVHLKAEIQESKTSIKEENNPFVSQPETQITVKDDLQNQEKFELMNISNSNSSSQVNDSEMSYYTSLKCYQAYRTQSAPEIVQTTPDLT